jgi:AcrR family transcriptional regulator
LNARNKQKQSTIIFLPSGAQNMTTSATQRRARTPPPERVETTQRKSIDSALALLREGGFKSATLQAIARGADVSLGALQHHFESRDALMERLANCR